MITFRENEYPMCHTGKQSPGKNEIYSPLSCSTRIGTSKFKVRNHIVSRSSAIPKSIRIRRQVERLSSPKTEYIPKDPFKYADFRGLLTADYKEALMAAFD